nr:MAG TPA: Repressor protein CI [Caudoviricetes sp.]
MPITEDDLKQLFSDRLTTLLEQNKITQAELANIVGVSESTVGKWLLKKAIPRMGVIQKLADYFGVGKSYFLEKDASGYYTDPETAAYAEELRTNPEMRMIFSAAKDISKESMKKTYEYIKFLKSQEEGNDD